MFFRSGNGNTRNAHAALEGGASDAAEAAAAATAGSTTGVIRGWAGLWRRGGGCGWLGRGWLGVG